jgi:hypothetical protein
LLATRISELRLTQPPLQPFIDASFHLLVRDDAAVFDVVFSFSHRGEKCDFICRIAIINVVWKSIDRLKNLFFNAHDARLAEPKVFPNGSKQKSVLANRQNQVAAATAPLSIHSVETITLAR